MECGYAESLLVSVCYGVTVPIPSPLPEGYDDAQDYAQATAPDMVATGDALLIHSETC